MSGKVLGSGDWVSVPCQAGVASSVAISVDHTRKVVVEVFDPPGGMVDGVHYTVTVGGVSFPARSGKLQVYNTTLDAGTYIVSVTPDKDTNLGIVLYLPSTR